MQCPCFPNSLWCNRTRYEFDKTTEIFWLSGDLLAQSQIFHGNPYQITGGEGCSYAWCAQTLAKNSRGFLASGASSLLGATEQCHMDHRRLWKWHHLPFSAYICISSWIVIKACSWDALSLLGYEAEEHQLSAANPLNSLDKFHSQFLLFGLVVTSLKVFLCRQWKAVTGYGQTNLMGSVTSGWLAWGEEGLQDPVLTTVSEACNLDPSVHIDILANKQTS